jgi:hypothetical protein
MNPCKRILIATAFVLAPLAALAQAIEPVRAINLAGEQRMLTQRIAKSFAQIGLNVLPLPAKQELDAALLRFEANLQALATATPTESTRASLARLRQAWEVLRQAARGAPRRESAILIAHLAEDALLAADAHLRGLQAAGGGAAGRLVAQAGRQRMLAQRIAKNYLLVSWGDDSDATRDELDVTVNEFAGALAALRQRGENTPEIAQELEEMAQHWEWLQTALAAEGAASYRLIVVEAAEAILGAADRVTVLYERLPR